MGNKNDLIFLQNNILVIIINITNKIVAFFVVVTMNIVISIKQYLPLNLYNQNTL